MLASAHAARRRSTPHHCPMSACCPLRGRERITQVVIHCTELPDLATARAVRRARALSDSGTGNSGHYYIDRDGRIEQYVALERAAHHVRGHNAHSLGIELVNQGRYPHWLDSRHQRMLEPYPEAQLQALESLLQWLRAQLLPALADIAGHDALDASLVSASDDPSQQVRRKLDPGPQFPWPRIRAAFDAAARASASPIGEEGLLAGIDRPGRASCWAGQSGTPGAASERRAGFRRD